MALADLVARCSSLALPCAVEWEVPFFSGPYRPDPAFGEIAATVEIATGVALPRDYVSGRRLEWDGPPVFLLFGIGSITNSCRTQWAMLAAANEKGKIAWRQVAQRMELESLYAHAASDLCVIDGKLAIVTRSATNWGRSLVEARECFEVTRASAIERRLWSCEVIRERKRYSLDDQQRRQIEMQLARTTLSEMTEAYRLIAEHVPSSVAQELTARSLGVDGSKLVAELSWHDAYLRWHDG